MYAEDDLLPISALQHLVFCPRQCALIHLEHIWADNRLTAEGRLLHERADSNTRETRPDRRIVRSLPLRSFRLGLAGKADVVEFRRLKSKSDAVRYNDASADNTRDPDSPDSDERSIVPETHVHGPEDLAHANSIPLATSLPLQGFDGMWRPMPVEYKRGKPKIDRCDEAQLCAQALCLEEMLGVRVNKGAIFYGQPRRRHKVVIDDDLREYTVSLARQLHSLISTQKTPPAVYGKKCRSCSLVNQCLPKATDNRNTARNYLNRAIKDAINDTGDVT